ncbi:MAG: hypothetical protein KGL11_09360 [Alphaproteobacteria bacterium]|nr:hypothetical protein [Alphaproteobacteria bacterium]
MSVHAGILLGIAITVAAVFGASLLRFTRRRSASALVQLLGAAGLVMVVLTHGAEALHWLPGMGWGRPNSAGHYLDLASAIVGVTLLPIGYLVGVSKKRSAPASREGVELKTSRR